MYATHLNQVDARDLLEREVRPPQCSYYRRIWEKTRWRHLFILVLVFALNKCEAEEEQRSSRWWWENARRLTEMGKILLGEDPLLLSGKHEGDVLLSPGENPNSKHAEEKNAVAQPSLLWPGGIIPYDFSTGYTVLPFERFLITRVMRDIERKSCVKFVPRTNENDYVKIIFDSYKCYSNVGRRGGEQLLSLGIFCVMFYDRGNVYHELLHVLGFHHEHNRPDRDDYIDVMWRNIRGEAINNFEKRPGNAVDLLGLPYDLDSVMHYSPHAFSKVYYILPTLVSHDRGIFFTRSRWPSKMDYAKLNTLYQCQKRRTSSPPHRIPPRSRPPPQNRLPPNPDHHKNSIRQSPHR